MTVIDARSPAVTGPINVEAGALLLAAASSGDPNDIFATDIPNSELDYTVPFPFQVNPLNLLIRYSLEYILASISS